MPTPVVKLQMSVTISGDSNPELLAYLQQFGGARERAMMLKLLAQRGLQLLASAGPDVLFLPGGVSRLPPGTVAAVSSPESPPRMPAPGRPPSEAVAVPYPVAISTSPAATADRGTLPGQLSSEAAGTTGHAALEGLDVGALNEAMARFG
ncbi:hypothetical protein L602_001500000040 [Cupriavidus gilardii J11]|uniref:Uncharacterized protein n=1 Tax=Cupriavidus gilardii J11 TaxID=936133 RepID=A0A562BRS1_9BURK|nr:hypothetical protein [Cupriavidus gilardii]TWG87871.1 hypothetical protein L602_001500000040 [Cupriavidus gilardii J11]